MEGKIGKRRKGYLLLSDAVVGLILFLAFLIIFGLFIKKVNDFKLAQKIATANSILASKLEVLQETCKDNPYYSNTENLTLGNETFEVKESCSPIGDSLVLVKVEVKKDKIQVKGESYVEQ